MLVLATLGAPERRRLGARRPRAVAPEPAPAPVTTARATVIDAEPASETAAREWLDRAGEAEAQAALEQIARAVQAYRIASADPDVHAPSLRQALVVRAGYGGGDEVAEGRWREARELPRQQPAKRRRTVGLAPQERLAALLAGHDGALACEELTLRARADVERGRWAEAAVQLRAALETALRELPAAGGGDMPRRVEALR